MNTLLLRHIAIDTYKENVAYLHRDCKLYRSEGFQALNKIEITNQQSGQSIIALLNIVDDARITAPDELGLSEQAFAQFGARERIPVVVAHAPVPDSIRDVHRKIAGGSLGFEDYRGIARDIASNRYSKIEIAAFLVACSELGLERDEVLYLTKAMIETGRRLDWGEPLVVDKHCIGGVPGNRTTMLIVPIVAAHGMLIPKTSSRAITSPAGTADTMEVLAQVELSPDKLHEIVRSQRACLGWGGTAALAPVDDILISVERPLLMDSPGQLVASILAKKVAAGATHLIIDIPIGPTAKVRDRKSGLALRKLFEYVSDQLGVVLEVVFTDGRQPVGRGIGPVLEVRDVLQVLENDPLAPFDLREKALQLAGRIIEFDPDVRGGGGYAIARDILDSGRASAKMQAIIDAQGRNPSPRNLGRLRHDILADRSGEVTAIDNMQLARIARLAGAPMDKAAGVDLRHKLGDTVKAGDPIYSIYAEFSADFHFSREAASSESGFTIA